MASHLYNSAIRVFNFSGQPCTPGNAPSSAGGKPCGRDGPYEGGWLTVCGGDGQRSCNENEWEENQPRDYDVYPDCGTYGFGDEDGPVALAWKAAMKSTRKCMPELQAMAARARNGDGPPVPGFNADGSLKTKKDGSPLDIPIDLSEYGYAAGGMAIGAFGAAFAGFAWYYGAVPGAIAGYLYGVSTK